MYYSLDISQCFLFVISFHHLLNPKYTLIATTFMTNNVNKMLQNPLKHYEALIMVTQK